MVMVNNSAFKETRGTVNGIGQATVATARAIGPTVGSLLFAWSESNSKYMYYNCVILHFTCLELTWPLNYHLTFIFCSINSIGLLLISFLLPKTIEKKREHK